MRELKVNVMADVSLSCLIIGRINVCDILYVTIFRSSDSSLNACTCKDSLLTLGQAEAGAA